MLNVMLFLKGALTQNQHIGKNKALFRPKICERKV